MLMKKKRRRRVVVVVVVFSNFLFVPSQRGEEGGGMGERDFKSVSSRMGEEGDKRALLLLGHIIEEAEDEGGGGRGGLGTSHGLLGKTNSRPIADGLG